MKIECIPLKFGNKEWVSTFTSSIQYGTESTSHGNTVRKGNEIHTGQKGINKTVAVYA